MIAAATNRRAANRTFAGFFRSVGLSFPLFCFIDFALGIQTFGDAIDR
jgi:hypothetical protein